MRELDRNIWVVERPQRFYGLEVTSRDGIELSDEIPAIVQRRADRSVAVEEERPGVRRRRIATILSRWARGPERCSSTTESNTRVASAAAGQSVKMVIGSCR